MSSNTVARSPAPTSQTPATTGTLKPPATPDEAPTSQVGNTALAERVMRTDRRGRKVLDAHRLPARYAVMNDQMNANVLGQGHAFPPILSCIQRYESGLGDPNRPVGSGFLGGPTGVGKTLTAEQIAIRLHGKPLYIKLACAELMEKAQLTGFIGASPSYVGHGKTVPLLTQEFIDAHRSEHSNIVVLLLDEFEKAHPDFQKLLLNVEENGILKIWVPKKPGADGKIGPNDGAEHVEVKMFNVLILKTTNAGVEKFAKRGDDEPKIGFGANVGGKKAEGPRPIPTPDEFRDELRTIFAPEFLNRQDFFVFYNWLEPKHMPLIRRREVAKVEALLNARPEMRGAVLRMTAAANRWVEKRGFDAEYGARPLRRLIQNEFVTPLGNLVSEGIIKPFDAVAAQPSEDGTRLDFVPLRLTAARAKEKLALVTAQDAASKDDGAVRVERLTAAIEAIMSALPLASGIHKALEAAVDRAGSASNDAERANILCHSIDAAIQGHRPLKPVEAPPEVAKQTPKESPKDPVRASALRALAAISSKGPSALRSISAAESARHAEPIKTAGKDPAFREQMIEALAELSGFLPHDATTRLAQAMFAAADKGPTAARVQLAEVLLDVALQARPSWSQAGEVREATAGAFMAAINLEADAAALTVGAHKTVEADRAMGRQAVKDAAEVSGVQPRGNPESELRSAMPFSILRKQLKADTLRDGDIARLDAMRQVIGDGINKGNAIPADKIIPTPAHLAQAVGIAYAALKIENRVLREVVHSTIDDYLEQRPLQATPRQLQDLEQLIRSCAGVPPEETSALCENFMRAQKSSGSVFRGGETNGPGSHTLRLPRRGQTPRK